MLILCILPLHFFKKINILINKMINKIALSKNLENQRAK